MDEIERWKFDVRQAMLDYASAEKRGDSAAIDATSTRACELVDELASKIAAERERWRAELVIARDALAGGLWDYGPGQDEHSKCDEVIARLDAFLRPNASLNGGRRPSA